MLIPMVLGLTVVTQGAINRRVGADFGLSSAVFLNAFLFFVLSGILLLWAKLAPHQVPEYWRIKDLNMDQARWWYLIPGLCGFLLVLGVPMSLQANGPSKTFILLIASQVVVSLLFEIFIFSTPISNMKLIGALLAAIGAAMVAIN